MKKQLLPLLAGLCIFIPLVGGCTAKEASISTAVEFNSHAASAYVSQDKGLFEAEGIKLATYESYVTGMALASALARGDIEVAYMCLVPAINVYANAGVPIRIVAGTHRYGYGLVVNPDKVRTITDLAQPDVRIGCVREGGATDILFCLTIDKYGLDKDKVLQNTQRMNPPAQVVAIGSGQLDAAFLPEHWATMATEYGFKMLLTSRDVWTGMQGSVLVVKEDLLRSQTELVGKIVKVTQQATDWINQHPEQAAEIMARQLGTIGEDILPAEAAVAASKLEITPDVMLRSMAGLDYDTSIDPKIVQQTIDYMAQLGYIKSSFDAQEILDLRFIN